MALFKNKKVKDVNYISAKESRRISRENRKITSEIEKKRNRKNVPREEYITKMRDPNNVLEFDNLHTYFFTDIGTVKSVDGVSFDIPLGKTVGVVGESGCGKSVTSLSAMQLVQRPQGQIVSGSIRFNTGKEVYDIAKTPTYEMQKLRGNMISMIFQEPMTSLNPVFRIGTQLDEVIELHNENMSKAEIKARSIEMLEMVGIANSEGVYKMYPHELSGGMRQRVMIAMGLACNPRLIIADEPTTALDVTIQAQILDLLRNLKDKINSSIMLITHDLGVIAEMADYVVVMYAGRVVERGTAEEIFKNPSHPYTIGLMNSKPVVGKKVDRLYSIPGKVPNPVDMPNYCYFRDRCDKCIKKCDGAYPEEIYLSPTHAVSCYLYYDKKGALENGN
ncbi:ABC transporter ATP-binding protein [Herbinix luporum]|uniref:Oligopeptide transport ATP-binding protein AppD n=1 Tax=Herbinix luporum TaxID=1679721 RepID=A0A0K8J3C0_9FIRM|nr:ABC transporter ATP-binding protein [Herbinix luporum]MDI9489043.1 ABC transporter ATP-binding protein [Bacillota bacterium]CUH91987.1 Oligopeptide transport ATP-binding protein AppD [Herbinix luporum]HHT56492.1 ABC transporter ATP-binding protein [Herbinix luporum]